MGSRVLANVYTLGMFGLTLFLFLTRQFQFAALSLIATIFLIAVLSMRGGASGRDEGILEDLSNDDRARLAPIRKLRREIGELVEARKRDVSVSVIGAEALQEADHILNQSAKMLTMRRQLRKAFSSRTEAERELADLEMALGSAGTMAERESLEAALEARRQEAKHYAEATDAQEKIDAALRQAEAALSEMKARLATAGSGSPESAAESQEELRETIARMRTLGTSLEEAEQWMRQ